MNVSIDHPTNKVNFSKVYVGNLTLWFSYKTIIAFQVGFGDIVCRENDWSSTTGRHMSEVGVDKRDRIPSGQFEVELAAALKNVS